MENENKSVCLASFDLPTISGFLNHTTYTRPVPEHNFSLNMENIDALREIKARGSFG